MEKLIRLGVVGLGHRGRLMMRLAVESFENIELVATCDLDAALWNDLAWNQDKPLKERFPKTKFYSNFDQMLAETPIDILMVETGADVHADCCIKALKNNVHVFSDIPSVASLEEAERLWAAKEASSAKFMTGANPNEWGFINALVDVYEKGLLGEPFYIETEYLHPMSDLEYTQLTEHSRWRKTFPPIRYCTHSLGPMLRILKEDLREVVCFGTGMHMPPEMRNDLEYNQDDMMSAMFRTDSNVVLRLLRSGLKVAARIGHHSYRVFGSKGYFERIDSRGNTPPVVRFQSSDFYGAATTMTELPIDMMSNEFYNVPASKAHGGADYALLAHMFQAFRAGDHDFPITLRDGLRMTLPGIYAAHSAKLGGCKLRIRYPWDADWTTELP